MKMLIRIMKQGLMLALVTDCIQLLVKKEQLVSAGITSTQEVKKLLRHYVTITLSNQQGMQHQMYNRVYFPTETDITNHILSARKALSFSQLDQQNLVEQINKWQEKNADASFYSRPFKLSESAVTTKEGHDN